MISEDSSRKLQLAKTLFDYLYLQDKTADAGAILGFGHFDQKIPLHCGKLYSEGFAPLIIFTGGVGAGSAGLKKPEAREFYDVLISYYPDISDSNIILEDKSTNTGENIIFSQVLLQKLYPEFTSVKKLLIVANAYRQRRVWLTCKKYFINVKLINSPPKTSFESEMEMFSSRNEDLCSHLVQELDRIKTYPDKGFIEKSIIPDKILQMSDELRNIIH